MATRGQVSREFWTVVTSTIAKHHLGIAQGCEQELRQMVDVGVQILDADHQLESAAAIRKAKERLRLFVNAMADEAKAQGRPELHEDIFAKLKKVFCPGFFPFC